MDSLLTKFTFTDELTDVIEHCRSVSVPTSKAELYDNGVRPRPCGCI